ncbi:unknown [Bacteroides sp. CAG:189]|nr:unknown [Bacteroides sp. CAG:189]
MFEFETFSAKNMPEIRHSAFAPFCFMISGNDIIFDF